MLRQGIIFVLVGPAGSGKTTLCHRLLAEFPDRLRYAVSATTRPPRSGEINGESYRFLTREEFLHLRDAGEFFEWEENHGQLYGTLKSTLVSGMTNGHDLLYQIDIRGALNFKKAYPLNTVITFLVPPAIGDLKIRLEKRGTTDLADLQRRLDTAQAEYEGLLKAKNGELSIDYVVVNNDLETAYDEVRAILIGERARLSRINHSSVRELCGVKE